MYLCHFCLIIPRDLLESLRTKTTSDDRLVSVPGVWISWWNQIFETGRLWVGHGGGRPLIHSLRHPNLRGSRNHCWNRVRLLTVLVSAWTWVGKDVFAPAAVYSDASWEGGGPERLSHHDFDLRKESVCFYVQEHWVWTFVPRLVLGLWQKFLHCG